MSLTHIETIELGSSQSSITFSSIPQDYDDLKILISARSDRGAAPDNINMRPNGSTANGSLVSLEGTGSSAVSFTQTTLIGGLATGNTATANTFGNSGTYISNYTANQNKSYSTDACIEDNASGWVAYLIAGLWSDTTAITSLEFVPNAGTNFLAGSVFSLYGITAGGDGTVTTA